MIEVAKMLATSECIPLWKDFIDKLPNDYVPIIGIGSLLSEKSARMTFPHLVNFRLAKMTGYRRIFCHPAPIFYKRGIAKMETKEMSSLSAEKLDKVAYEADPELQSQTIKVTTFEIPKHEIPAFIEREEEFDFSIVEVIDIKKIRMVITEKAQVCYAHVVQMPNISKSRVENDSMKTANHLVLHLFGILLGKYIHVACICDIVYLLQKIFPQTFTKTSWTQRTYMIVRQN